MANILTGVQSTGTPHLGNLLGAIIPAIALSKKPENQSFLFIADLHSITQIKDGETLLNNTYSTAAAWLACGLDVNKVIFYRQSDVPQTAELSWYLSCFFPYQRLTLAHLVLHCDCLFYCVIISFFNHFHIKRRMVRLFLCIG